MSFKRYAEALNCTETLIKLEPDNALHVGYRAVALFNLKR